MRHEFSRKTMVEAWKIADGRCQKCGVKLYPGATHYDHIRPCELGGEPIIENCAVLCKTCHMQKTMMEDVPRIAKAKRQQAAHIGAKAKRHRWGYGRGDRLKKKISGRVVPRGIRGRHG